jgi:pre-mRNA-splicing helicase BRR2
MSLFGGGMAECFPQVRKPFYIKFLNEGLPIESHLHLALADHFCAEIVAKTIEVGFCVAGFLVYVLLSTYRRRISKRLLIGLHGHIITDG